MGAVLNKHGAIQPNYAYYGYYYQHEGTDRVARIRKRKCLGN